MKTNKLIVKALAVLGFGAVAGMASSCGAGRAQKSKTAQTVPAADSVAMPDKDAPLRTMYGVPPARFDENKPLRQRAE